MSAEKSQPPQARRASAPENSAPVEAAENCGAAGPAAQTDAASPAVQTTPEHSPRRNTSIRIAPQPSAGGGRFWALPDKNLKYWVLCENDRGNVESLTGGNPVIFIPPLSESKRKDAAECCRQMVVSRLRDRSHEHLFQLIKRVMLGGVLTLAGIFAMRVVPQVDWFLLAGAIGYTGYASLRYGGRFLNSWEASSRPFSHFQGEPFVESKLAERLAKALEFRRNLPAEKRGESPDDELLDANAYRKLIREGAVTKNELVALGKAIEARLNIDGREPRLIHEMARDEGLDPESAALYRDLAQAAGELEYDSDL